MPPVFLTHLDDVPADGAIAVDVAGQAGAPLAVLVARTANGVAAYVNACPHLGARLETASGVVLRKRDHIFCAHHSAIFEAATGACIWGPCAGKALSPLAVEIEEGRVWLT